MRWADHVAHMGDEVVHTGFWLRDKRKGDHFEGGSVDLRVILKWNLKKEVTRGVDWIELAQDRDR